MTQVSEQDVSTQTALDVDGSDGSTATPRRGSDATGSAGSGSAGPVKPVPGFDRIRPADSAPRSAAPRASDRDTDVQGKRALFSGAAQPPSVGSVAIRCGGCSVRSVVSYVRLAKLWATGIYVPLPGSNQRAWLKCPACHKHEWVTINIKS